MEVSRSFETLVHAGGGVLREPKWKLLQNPTPKSCLEEEEGLRAAIGVGQGGGRDTAAMAGMIGSLLVD